MQSLLSNKRGDAIEVSLNPVFTIVTGVLVTLTLLAYITGLGTSTEFEKQFIAADNGLLFDSVHAARKDVNLFVNYPATKYNIDYSGREVAVYQKEPKTAKKFWFNENSAYDYTYAKIPENTPTTVYRNGNSIGIGQPTNLATPYCEPSHQKLNIITDPQAITQLGKQPTQLASGDVTIHADAEPGSPSITIYTNTPLSEQAACKLAQNIYQQIPGIEGHAIIPINTQLLSPEDSRQVLNTNNPTLYLRLTLPSVTPEIQTKITRAVNEI